MNLVQINERLKDLPMQVVQQYANGMNPEVPPYLALGELQRREMSQKQMATAQGAQQGPQPSVKEQVEQKAGLMQLQQMQQQQMAQQMQQPRGPMPVPAGAPQPQDQPEASQAMMARGGLAGIPVRRDMFEYARGGIIAFQAGGQPKYETPYDRRNRENREAAQKSAQERVPKAMEVTESNAQALAETAQARVNELESKREELTRRFGPNMYEQALAKAKQEVDAASSRGSELIAQQSAMGQERMAAATPQPAAPFGSKFAPVNPADMMGSPAGLPAALAKAAPTGQVPPPAAGPSSAPRTTAPRPSAIPAAMPPVQAGPQPNVSPFLAEAATMAREKPVAPTAEGVIKDVNALLPAGLQEAAQKKMFDDQRARADERKAAFEKSKPSGLDDLIRVFGQSGQFKGGTGMAPAYTANQDRKRAQELGFQKEQDELLSAIDARRTAADEKLFGARTGAMTAANKAFQDRLLTNTKALADLSGVDQSRIDNALRNLNQMEVEKLRSATQNRSLNEKLKFEADFMAIKARAMKLAEEGDAPGAARLEAQANSMLASRGLGGTGSGTAAVGADNAQTRKLRDAVKDIDSRLEFLDPKTPEAKALQADRDRLSKLIVQRAIGEADAGGESPTAKPITKAEYDKLPKGATYTAPDGSQRTKG